MTAESAEPSGRRRRWWRVPSGVRASILGWYVVLLAGVIAAGLLLQREVLLQVLDRQIAEALEQEADELRALASGVDPGTGRPLGADAQAVLDRFLDQNLPSSGEVLIALVDGQPPRSTATAVSLIDDADRVDRWRGITESEAGEFPTAAGPVRYLAVPLIDDDGRTEATFVVAYFVSVQREEIEEAVVVTALVLLLCLILFTAMAWFVAGRILRPMHEVTRTARTITEGAFGSRIPVRGRDEVAELAASFNAMVDRLEAASETQRRFISDAGHELRTPITIISGHLEMLGADPEPGEWAETMAVVTDELTRMSRMVDDLLLLARAQIPDFLHREPVRVDTFLTDLAARCRTLGHRRWTLVGDVADVEVLADRQRLLQAMLNLARNAVAHTAEGQHIEIGADHQAGEVRLWVRDEGVGIPEQDRSRIFERFARGSSRRRSADGAGLGLAIVSAIVTAHGGTVGVHSEVGVGSTFTLRLPAEPRRAAALPLPEDAAEATPVLTAAIPTHAPTRPLPVADPDRKDTPWPPS